MISLLSSTGSGAKLGRRRDVTKEGYLQNIKDEGSRAVENQIGPNGGICSKEGSKALWFCYGKMKPHY